MAERAPTEAVLIDALGTLVELLPPGTAFAAALRERCGVEVGEGEASAALRAEIAFYRAHHLEGRDADSLAALRLRCAEVARAALPAAARESIAAPELLPAMLASLRFQAFPEARGVLEELRQRGLRLAVVSNWDVSLPEVLADLALAPLLDATVTSAAAGAAKPDPAIFAAALAELGVEPGAAIHVGDSPELDLAGARAAGIRAVLIDREGPRSPPRPNAAAVAHAPVIASLTELRALL